MYKIVGYETADSDAAYDAWSIILSAAERGGNKKPSPAPETDHSINESMMGDFILNSVAI